MRKLYSPVLMKEAVFLAEALNVGAHLAIWAKTKNGETAMHEPIYSA
jgi:hypothetical protein